MLLRELGRTGIRVPPIVFGTSCLGNLYEALPADTKLAILREFIRHVPAPVVLDSAGKYGAGLALETIGRGLRTLGVPPENVLLSNKLAWLRVPLRGPEPTFEPGAWVGLEHDAVQRIDHDGILECWTQGCALLAPPYRPTLASVHDPDEYLNAATTPADRVSRVASIHGAYRALADLKRQGQVRAIGVGAKDWRVIRDIADHVDLDWVMLACSLTVLRHPPELLAFVADLHRRGIGIVNSAVFHAGFLTGGPWFDYRKPDPAVPADAERFRWRERFTTLCRRHAVSPAAACVQFALTPPGVAAVALNTSRPERVGQNVALVQTVIPPAFWTAMKDANLLNPTYPYTD